MIGDVLAMRTAMRRGEPRTTLVLGGYGVSGAGTVALLREAGGTTLTAGRDAARADRVVDLARLDERALDAALRDVEVVVNASGIEEPALVDQCTQRGAAFVDITASTAYVAALEHLRPSRPVLLSVGLAPGLTNLLAVAAHKASPGPIDLALVLGAGERHGAAGVEWTYRLLGRRFADPSGARVRNFTRSLVLSIPEVGRRRVYRVDFSDQHTLTRDLRAPVRTYFALDSRLATTALALLTHVPGGSRTPRSVHLPGGERWLAVARATNGTTRWATGERQAHATAVITAIAARSVLALPAGVHHLHHVMTLDDLAAGLGIDVHEATCA